LMDAVKTMFGATKSAGLKRQHTYSSTSSLATVTESSYAERSENKPESETGKSLKEGHEDEEPLKMHNATRVGGGRNVLNSLTRGS